MKNILFVSLCVLLFVAATFAQISEDDLDLSFCNRQCEEKNVKGCFEKCVGDLKSIFKRQRIDRIGAIAKRNKNKIGKVGSFFICGRKCALIKAYKERFHCHRLCKQNIRSAIEKPAFLKQPAPEKDDDEDSTRLDSTALWARYRETIFKFITKSGKRGRNVGVRGLQMVTDTLEATWAENPMNLALQADTVSKYGSLYEPTTLKLPTQYDKFLNNIDIPFSDPFEKRELMNIQDKYMDVTDDLFEKKFDCEMDHSTWGQKFSYSTFENIFCPRVHVAHKKMLLVNSQMQALKTKSNNGFQQVFEAINKFSFNEQQGWRETGVSLQNFLTRARKGQATRMNLVLSSSTSNTEMRHWEKKKTSGFFIFKATKKGTEKEVRFNKEHFHMSMSADGFEKINISPSWLDAYTVRKFKNAKKRNKSLRFFGDGGSMPLLPTAFYVVYNPKVHLDVGREDGLFFESHKESSFSFAVFNSNKGSTMKVDKKDADNYTVDFQMNSDTAYIIAVDNHVW